MAICSIFHHRARPSPRIWICSSSLFKAFLVIFVVPKMKFREGTKLELARRTSIRGNVFLFVCAVMCNSIWSTLVTDFDLSPARLHFAHRHTTSLTGLLAAAGCRDIGCSSYRMRIGLSYGSQALVICRVADPFPYWFHINMARL